MELDLEPSAGAVYPDGDGIDADAEHGGDLRVRQSLPGQEAQQLLLVAAQPPQRLDGRTRWAVLGHQRSGHLFAPVQESPAAHFTAALIGQHPPADAVEPGSSRLASRDLAEASPGDGERLRDSVLGIRCLWTPAKGLGEHGTGMLREDLVKIEGVRPRALISHRSLDGDPTGTVPS